LLSLEGVLVHRDDDWSVVVVRCRVEDRGNILWKLSDFLEQDEKVLSFHFRFGGIRIEDRVIMLYICFRVSRKMEDKEAIESHIESMLTNLAEVGEGNFKINPTERDVPFNTYVAWFPIEGGVDRWGGEDNWKEYMLVLARLSRIVSDLAKKGLFDMGKRAETLHLFANMLQLHEIGVTFGGVRDFINPNEIRYYR